MLKKDEFLVDHYIPFPARPLVEQWITDFPVHIDLVAPRKTKCGDYRVPRAGTSPRITINRDHNPYRFLIVLVHELAHHIVHIRHGYGVRPHGMQWKVIFFQMLQDLNQRNVFPLEVSRVLPFQPSDLRASTCGNRSLFKMLKKYDENLHKHTRTLEELAPNTIFKLPNGHKFKKMGKKRVRILCQSLKNKKYYLFSPDFEVVNRD